jgi:hypothetical protein
MRPVDLLLANLDRVRPTGSGQWIARCPAHDDKRPSLSIAVGENDAALIHCWAGCSAGEIVAALGLDLCDLFPLPLPQGKHAARPRRVSPLTPLIVRFQLDLVIVKILLADIEAGKCPNDADRKDAKAASDRIWQALWEARYVL